MIFVTILAAWLLADFVGGLLHWVEDRLLVRPSRFQWLRKIQLENTRHHQSPAAMLKLSWYGNIRQTLPASNIVAMALIALGAPLLIVLTVMALGVGNLIHRFAHEKPATLPTWVRVMQKTGLFLSFDQHLRHHFGRRGRIANKDASRHFCPMTSWLNPVLDRIRFFRFLDFVFRLKTPPAP